MFMGVDQYTFKACGLLEIYGEAMQILFNELKSKNYFFTQGIFDHESSSRKIGQNVYCNKLSEVDYKSTIKKESDRYYCVIRFDPTDGSIEENELPK